MDAETLGWIFASGMCTAVGGLFLLVVRHPTGRLLDVLLGFTAGVMLAATAFSLLVPALDRGGVGEVLAGFLLGAATLLVLDRYVPHVHERMKERGRPAASELRARHRARLLLSALTIHNLPEGMAVGLAFAAPARHRRERSWCRRRRRPDRRRRASRRARRLRALEPSRCPSRPRPRVRGGRHALRRRRRADPREPQRRQRARGDGGAAGGFLR